VVYGDCIGKAGEGGTSSNHRSIQREGMTGRANVPHKGYEEKRASKGSSERKWARTKSLEGLPKNGTFCALGFFRQERRGDQACGQLRGAAGAARREKTPNA